MLRPPVGGSLGRRIRSAAGRSLVYISRGFGKGLFVFLTIFSLLSSGPLSSSVGQFCGQSMVILSLRDLMILQPVAMVPVASMIVTQATPLSSRCISNTTYGGCPPDASQVKRPGCHTTLRSTGSEPSPTARLEQI